MTSLRSVMWSLWRWVSSTADSWGGSRPAPTRRIRTPRPASTRRLASPAWTSDDGPARFGSGSGLPVPSTVSRTGSAPSNEGRNDLGDLGPLVLLEEVAAALDGRVGLALGAGHASEERPLAALGDRVAVAEGAQDGPVEASEDLPRRDLILVGRVVGSRRDEGREAARPGLVGVVGERSVVGGNDRRGEVAEAAAVDDPADRELLGLLREPLPGEEG